MPGICELPVSRIHDGRNYRFFVLKPLRIGLHKIWKGSQFRHENKKQVQSPLRLVGSMCKWRARARILRIGICRSEQERSFAAKTADYPEKGDKSLLRKDHSVWHSTTMHSVRWVRSDYRKPDFNYRAAILRNNSGKNQHQHSWGNKRARIAALLVWLEASH